MNLKKVLTLVFFSLFLTACDKSPEQIAFSGKTMGTTYNVKYIDNGKIQNLPNAADLQAKMDDLLRTVNSEMSTYQKDSQISKFNQMKEANSPFAVSADFAKVVQEAMRLNKVTDKALSLIHI